MKCLNWTAEQWNAQRKYGVSQRQTLSLHGTGGEMSNMNQVRKCCIGQHWFCLWQFFSIQNEWIDFELSQNNDFQAKVFWNQLNAL